MWGQLCCVWGRGVWRGCKPSRRGGGQNTQFFSDVSGKLSFTSLWAAILHTETVDDDFLFLLFPQFPLTSAPPFGEVETLGTPCMGATANDTLLGDEPDSVEGYTLSAGPVVPNNTAATSVRSAMSSTVTESKCPLTRWAGFNITVPATSPAPYTCTSFLVGQGTWTIRNLFLDAFPCVQSGRNTEGFFYSVGAEIQEDSWLTLSGLHIMSPGTLVVASPPEYATNASTCFHESISIPACVVQWQFQPQPSNVFLFPVNAQGRLGALQVTGLVLANSTLVYVTARGERGGEEREMCGRWGNPVTRSALLAMGKHLPADVDTDLSDVVDTV
mgnify:CR=1 FL=1